MPQRSKPNKPTIGEIKPPYGPTAPPGPAGPTAPPAAPPVGPCQLPTPCEVVADVVELCSLIEAMPPGSGLQHNADGALYRWTYMTPMKMYGHFRPRAFYADTPLDALRQAVEEQASLDYYEDKLGGG